MGTKSRTERNRTDSGKWNKLMAQIESAIFKHEYIYKYTHPIPGEVGGAHWAPKSDLRRKIQNNFCDVGVNFLVSDGIK